MNKEEVLKRIEVIEDEASELRKLIDQENPVVGGVYERAGNLYMITNWGSNVLLNGEYAGETNTYSAEKVAEWAKYIGKIQYSEGVLKIISESK